MGVNVTEHIMVNGQDYEITNWDEFIKQVLFLLGEALVNRVQEKAMAMHLFDSGRFIRGIRAEVVGNTIILTDDVEYGKYLEFGTYEFGLAFGDNDFPAIPFPKKKNLSRSSREAFPRGMQPFAPFRRVLYNQLEMDKALREAFG